MLMKPCVECGALSERNRCEEHRIHASKPSATARGYDQAWRRLAERAVKLQPFCDLCLTPDDLTVDHSTEAWERKARGLTIRLQDVRVLCRSCNSKAGRARPRGDDPREGDARPPGKALFGSHIVDRSVS